MFMITTMTTLYAFRGEPAGGTKIGGHVGNGNSSLISSLARALQCVGISILKLAKSTDERVGVSNISILSHLHSVKSELWLILSHKQCYI